jgi:hypothetical protein
MFDVNSGYDNHVSFLLIKQLPKCQWCIVVVYKPLSCYQSSPALRHRGDFVVPFAKEDPHAVESKIRSDHAAFQHRLNGSDSACAFAFDHVFCRININSDKLRPALLLWIRRGCWCEWEWLRACRGRIDTELGSDPFGQRGRAGAVPTRELP